MLSEKPFGLEPQARHFPQRNRIVAGLSQAVIVVEAAIRSGSLITARIALDQGREVMAVPGHPMDSRAAGVNLLIRDGAVLVRHAEDVIDALGGRLPPRPPRPAPGASPPCPTARDRRRARGRDPRGARPLAHCRGPADPRPGAWPPGGGAGLGHPGNGRSDHPQRGRVRRAGLTRGSRGRGRPAVGAVGFAYLWEDEGVADGSQHWLAGGSFMRRERHAAALPGDDAKNFLIVNEGFCPHPLPH